MTRESGGFSGGSAKLNAPHENRMKSVATLKVADRAVGAGGSGAHLRRRTPLHESWLHECHIHATTYAMKTTIDAAGRIVVPKALREALHFKPGQPLEMRAGDGRLEIEIAATPVKLVKRGKGVVAVPETPLPKLTAEQVRDTLERVRR